MVPASHLLAAAGAAEQPRDPPKAAGLKKAKSSALQVGASSHLAYGEKKKVSEPFGWFSLYPVVVPVEAKIQSATGIKQAGK